ncbi:MAG: 50S ribosomal protein L21 [Rickettsiales bacterium]|nr:50S ribosomal protein L21 [Rickettsiales bacterium]
MFAIFKTGGKQYKVEKGDVLSVEKLDAEKQAEFGEVLAIDGKIGTPTLPGAKVTAEIVRHAKGDKVIVFKKKRRQNYRRTAGHRQARTEIKITDIKG